MKQLFLTLILALSLFSENYIQNEEKMTIEKLTLNGQPEIKIINNKLIGTKKFLVKIIDNELIISTPSTLIVGAGNNIIINNDTNIIINNDTIINKSDIIINNNTIINESDILINNTSLNKKNIGGKATDEEQSSNIVEADLSAKNGSEVTTSKQPSGTEVKQKGGVLEYDLKNIILDLKNIKISGQSSLKMEQHISLNNLSKIKVSGQSLLELTNLETDLTIELSGQSNIEILNLTSKNKLDININGQSTLNVINSNCNEVVAEASGMSKIKLKNTKINNLKKESSGMSQIVVQ